MSLLLYQWSCYYLEQLTSHIPLYVPTQPKSIDKLIIDGSTYYISDANSASDEEMLKFHNIKSIISIRTPWVPCSPIYSQIDQLGKSDLDVKLFKIYFWDHPSEDVVSHLEKTECWMKANNISTNVLIHCTMGKSRSAALLIGYIMIHHEKDFSSAYDLVKSIRPQVKLNSGFETQLKNLDEQLQRIK